MRVLRGRLAVYWWSVTAMTIMALALLGSGPACAGEFVAVEVGSSGEILENHAYHQPKHYLKQDADLGGRIACLMEDVDALLERLHAQPAELSDGHVLEVTADDELSGLFALAVDNNKDLRAPRSELAALAAKTRQEGAKPDPMVMLGLEDLNTPLPVLSNARDSRVNFSLSQEFVSYGKRGLRREIAHRDELLKELELKQMELDLLLEVTEAYYNLFGTEASLRSLDQNIKLMGILLELANRKYAAGTTPQAAVMAAQVQLSQMEAMRIELVNTRDQQRTTLEGLLGRPEGFSATELKFDAPYPLPPSPEWDNAELMPEILAHRPDYQRLEEMLDQQDLKIELAQREYRPDYKVSATYGVSAGMQDSLMAEVEVPVFTHKEERQDAMVQENYAMQAVTQDELCALQDNIQTKMQNYESELKMHAGLVDLYRKGLVPQARLSLDSNIAAYSADMMDLSDLLMAQQSLLTQEQELEQNYIHILHTLADLQLTSAGVFDPRPWLVPADDAAGKSAANPFDLANQAIADQARQQEQGLLLPAPDGSAQGGADGEFIGPLKLPGKGQPPPEGGEVDEKAEPSSSDEAAEDDDGFYAPFSPQDEEEADTAESVKSDDGGWADPPSEEAAEPAAGKEKSDEH